MSFGYDTKDVDLQREALQQAQIQDRANSLVSQFGIQNLTAAKQLVQLADKMQVMQTQANGMSDDDRNALAQAALGVAGITNDEVNTAYANLIKGDQSSVNNLMTKAAVNLGMPNTAGLRDQILPSLGINLGPVGK